MKTEGKKCDNKIVGWETGTSFNEVETSGMLDHFRFLAKVVGTNKKSLIGFLFCSPIHLTALSRCLCFSLGTHPTQKPDSTEKEEETLQ